MLTQSLNVPFANRVQSTREANPEHLFWFRQLHDKRKFFARSPKAIARALTKHLFPDALKREIRTFQ